MWTSTIPWSRACGVAWTSQRPPVVSVRSRSEPQTRVRIPQQGGRKSRQARHCHHPASARFSSITAFRANRKLLTNPFLFSFNKQRMGRRRSTQTLSIMDILLELSSREYAGYPKKMSNTPISDMLDLNIWLSLTSNFGVELRM